MKKSNPTIKAQIVRGVFYVLLLLGICAIPFALAKRSFDGRTTPATPSKQTQRTLTFAERVAYQRAIEDVYWRHRIWPRNGGERPDPKPSLDAVMSQAQLERKVEDYLRESQALEDYWQRPITADQLQAEMDRMAKNTKQSEILRELFQALGNDPFVIAECLATPALADRLLTSWYAYDQRFHGELKQRAEAELKTYPTVEQMKRLSGTYSEVEVIKSDNAPAGDHEALGHSIRIASQEWDQMITELAATFNKPAVDHMNDGQGPVGRTSAVARAAVDDDESVPVSKLSMLQEDETRFYATAVIESTGDHIKLATVSWLKQSPESWLARSENQVSGKPTVGTGYTLPAISELGGTCIDDTWRPTSTTPTGRYWHTTVWTGSEMIVWGGWSRGGTNTGAKYNPTTDSWVATNLTNAPAYRYLHTAVWTGNEMIVWGGSG